MKTNSSADHRGYENVLRFVNLQRITDKLPMGKLFFITFAYIIPYYCPLSVYLLIYNYGDEANLVCVSLSIRVESGCSTLISHLHYLGSVNLAPR